VHAIEVQCLVAVDQATIGYEGYHGGLPVHWVGKQPRCHYCLGHRSALTSSRRSRCEAAGVRLWHRLSVTLLHDTSCTSVPKEECVFAAKLACPRVSIGAVRSIWASMFPFVSPKAGRYEIDRIMRTLSKICVHRSFQEVVNCHAKGSCHNRRRCPCLSRIGCNGVHGAEW
jgi:hypothetical protein